MNQKQKTLFGLVVFGVLLAGAVFAYNILQDSSVPDNIVMLDIADSQDAQAAHAEQKPEDEQKDAEPEEESEQLQQAPNFTMLDAYGNELQLSDFFGKPIVLNFWTTWCPSCVRESPYFENLYQELGNEVHIIKVNLLDGRRETRAAVDNFMYENGYTFPLYFDIDGAAAFGVRFIPMTFFICENGYLTAMAQGAVNDESLRQGLGSVRPFLS